MSEVEKCDDCDSPAVWFYMPGDYQRCDEHVHRGCSCNEYSIVAEHYHPPGGIRPDEDTREGVDWIWTNEEKTSWANVDSKGRRWPCCEWDYDGPDLD